MSTNARQLQAEQITLLLRNMYSSLWPAIVVALALAYTLEPAHGKFSVLCWAIAVISSRPLPPGMRSLLAQPILPAQAPALVRRLLLLNAIDGIAGARAVGLRSAGRARQRTGDCRPVRHRRQFHVAAVARAACLRGVLVGELGMLALKRRGPWANWLIRRSAWRHWPIWAGLLSQGYNSTRATRAAIELRFENIDLIEMLKVESARASDAREAAEQANHAKSRFLAAASHDLRQPIHAQSLFLEVLARSRPHARATGDSRQCPRSQPGLGRNAAHAAGLLPHRSRCG
jgi:hypothetical protein